MSQKSKNLKRFDFKKQMAVGDVGEAAFLNFYSHLSPKKSEDRKYDFQSSVGTIELKTDTYPMKDTPNFFMERYGDITKKSPGGPWRAAEDGVDFFVYFYLTDGTIFWFKTEELSRVIEQQVQKKRERWIRNKGWTAMGYLVPREELTAVTFRVDTIPSDELAKFLSEKHG